MAVAYTMWATPGPNNLMLAYSGARFGVRRTLPHILGVLTGTVLLNSAGIVVLAPIIERWPAALLMVKVVGTVWLLRIGVRMARSTIADGPRDEEQPMSFASAALFQFANPKAITAASALASLVLAAASEDRWLLPAALLLIPALCILANGPWAVAGHAIRRSLTVPWRWRLFTWGTGGLTAGCAIFLWI
ncbi:threonine/homoserine/homoserine lactone efflux protein [Amorphus orientalis]|uniref:Threonine/homoserine/homoserine lactone efflux protein n=1 Tax=Amorphus orientalis TaxID=649198 RepID=A0AAE4ATE1_9HYPH|nr:threonine/homoserine/homoserine lactone efflux protein [Amorphus orientalis]